MLQYGAVKTFCSTYLKFSSIIFNDLFISLSYSSSSPFFSSVSSCSNIDRYNLCRTLIFICKKFRSNLHDPHFYIFNRPHFYILHLHPINWRFVFLYHFLKRRVTAKNSAQTRRSLATSSATSSRLSIRKLRKPWISWTTGRGAERSWRSGIFPLLRFVNAVFGFQMLLSPRYKFISLLQYDHRQYRV